MSILMVLFVVQRRFGSTLSWDHWWTSATGRRIRYPANFCPLSVERIVRSQV